MVIVAMAQSAPVLRLYCIITNATTVAQRITFIGGTCA
jgi:hypothetical protein